MPLIWLFSILIASGFTTGSEPEKKLVLIGDSLTEGFGVSRERAYPAILQKKIEAAGKNWKVMNSGVSGSTSASAPSRVEWILRQRPDLILLALGGNDGLRGTNVKSMEEGLAKAIEKCQQAKVTVILAGMKLPPNLGRQYNREFEGVFPRLAKKYGIPLIPFLLENVGGYPKLNLPDGIHPNEKGHEIIAETVFKALEKHW